MEIEQNNKCVKTVLPNGVIVDVLCSVLNEIVKWTQNESSKTESGGFIVGYQHSDTGNISLEAVSSPYSLDIKSRVSFEIRDPRHQIFLKKAKRRRSYYMGVWHTHPQIVPEPSQVDWDDWNATLLADRTGCPYVFFLIAGINEWRMWVGDFNAGTIYEAKECLKDAQGIYMK